MTGALAPLLELSGVADALASARDAVDQALRHPALRRAGGRVAAEIGLRSAVASATLDGHGYPLDEVRAGTVTDAVVQGALRVTRELDGLAPLWPKVPRQVLARLHLLSARDTVPPAALGRPSDDGAVPRLHALFDLVTTESGAPALLLAAVVHAELASLRAFAGPNGVLARAAARLTLVSGGLDPRGLIAPDLGHLAREPEYVGALGAYATGTPDGLRAWFRHYASAATAAAEEAVTVGDEVLAQAGP
ncbi:MAG TPA: oxidoreductase [Rugosimonospora sp.]|nr:oxidoreductase [Rugosimonospora sp.]